MVTDLLFSIAAKRFSNTVRVCIYAAPLLRVPLHAEEGGGRGAAAAGSAAAAAAAARLQVCGSPQSGGSYMFNLALAACQVGGGVCWWRLGCAWRRRGCMFTRPAR
jgi:hypothetical protein